MDTITLPSPPLTILNPWPNSFRKPASELSLNSYNPAQQPHFPSGLVSLSLPARASCHPFSISKFLELRTHVWCFSLASTSVHCNTHFYWLQRQFQDFLPLLGVIERIPTSPSPILPMEEKCLAPTVIKTLKDHHKAKSFCPGPV